MGRGLSGLILKAFKARDFRFTVISTEDITEDYRMVRVNVGSLFEEFTYHPTFWFRAWFPKCEATEKPGVMRELPKAGECKAYHARAYTLINPDTAKSEACIGFSMHDGIAANWARQAKAGDTLDVSILGTSNPMPKHEHDLRIIIGDATALSAINGLLTNRQNSQSAAVYFIQNKPSDSRLPILELDGDKVYRIDKSSNIIDTLIEEKIKYEDLAIYAFVYAEKETTKKVVEVLKNKWKLNKNTQITAMPYWKS